MFFEIQWCYYSNESSLAELLQSIHYFLGFYKKGNLDFSMAIIRNERVDRIQYELQRYEMQLM